MARKRRYPKGANSRDFIALYYHADGRTFQLRRDGEVVLYAPDGEIMEMDKDWPHHTIEAIDGWLSTANGSEWRKRDIERESERDR